MNTPPEDNLPIGRVVLSAPSVGVWSLAMQLLNTRPVEKAAHVSDGYKQCSGTKGCGKVLPAEKFNLSGVLKNGVVRLKYVCKECETRLRRKREQQA